MHHTVKDILEQYPEIAGYAEKQQCALNGLREVQEHTVHNIHSLMNIMHPQQAFMLFILSHCLASHDPDSTILKLKQLTSSIVPEDFSSFSSDTARIVGSILSFSSVLSGRLSADTSLIYSINSISSPLEYFDNINYYTGFISDQLESTNISSEKIKVLHRSHTTQLARLCARNSDPSIPISEINHELSLLAEATVSSALSIAFCELAIRIGSSLPPHSLCVLALGKFGGNELNVSSDIDLIYLKSSDSVTYGNYDSMTFHTILAERLTRILSEHTELGFLYRVDTRLRADGSSGPLVRTTADYFRYLEVRGEAWERQMLVKARPVAGDVSGAEMFLQSLDRFIYPTALTRSPNREIVEIKKRIESRLVADGSKKTHLKLLPGGVRDIEFIAQCLQLLMGGAHPSVRVNGTLDALDLLHKANALNDDEFNTLTDGYILYRKIENALQWRDFLPAFTLPDNPSDQADLAYRINFSDYEALLSCIEKTRLAVRGVFDSVFNEPTSFEDSLFHAALKDDERSRRFLESLGFNNASSVSRTLNRLVHGENSEIHDTTIHPTVIRFIPKLVRAVSVLPDPGGTLERFANIVSSYRARHMLFDILDSSETFFNLLLSISQSSLFIADIIASDPSLLDWLVESGEILHPVVTRKTRKELTHIVYSSTDDSTFSQKCFLLKNREKVRIGSRDISELATTLETFRDLSKTAELIVQAAYQYSSDHAQAMSKTIPSLSFSIMAAGRLGAETMDFGSDLDLVFVFDASDEDYYAQESAVRLAQNIVRLLSGEGANRVYEIDARLRPEGGGGVLAVSYAEYKRYLAHRASEWERLALTRLRTVGGDKSLGDKIEEIINTFVYQGFLSRNEIEKILKIRTIMAEKSRERSSGRINVKSGLGGLADIDFIAQTYAVHFGHENKMIRHRATLPLIESLGNEGLIDSHVASILSEHYHFLCDVEKALRIGSGRSINALPSSETETSRIARLVGFKNTRRFKNRLRDVTELVSGLYQELMTALLDQASNATEES